jgi:hypothetical protein
MGQTYAKAENAIKKRETQRILVRAQERWKDQAANERGAAKFIREDRDAR